MKTTFILLFFLITESIVWGQKKEIAINSPNTMFDCLIINLNEQKNTESRVLPYKEIIFIDERIDTSKCGYWFQKRKSTKKLCFNEGFEKAVSYLVNNHIKKNLSTNNSIAAYVKKCWINSSIIVPSNSSEINTHSISIKIDFFLKSGSCNYPLYRFEKTLTDTTRKFSEPRELLEYAILSSIDKLFTTSVIPSTNCISLTTIDSLNNHLETLPIFSDSKIQKGVYLNFAQFKNNQPAYPDFKISLDEKADVLYVKGVNIKDSIITDAWGFSDGENLFTRINMNFFPLFRCGNTFDLYSIDKVTRNKFYQGQPMPYHNVHTEPIPSAVDMGVQVLLGMIKTKSTNFKPYQIDMETGELY